ncbi:MAG TPA: hypothetical protein PK372_08410 [Rugosibacter sp.]|nr:hypothetical protein [Methylophilus sp.]HQQ35931.1 hypothetical protein [Rugosibacter sp.]
MAAVQDLSKHILPVSATMVGVCMTVITIMQLVPKNTISYWADEMIAIDSLLFLASTMLSYWSVRHKDDLVQIEKLADRCFFLGMVLMVGVNFLVAFELFKS